MLLGRAMTTACCLGAAGVATGQRHPPTQNCHASLRTHTGCLPRSQLQPGTSSGLPCTPAPSKRHTCRRRAVVQAAYALCVCRWDVIVMVGKSCLCLLHLPAFAGTDFAGENVQQKPCLYDRTFPA